MSISDTLRKYNDLTLGKFDERDVNSELVRIPGLKQDQLTVEELAEMMAFGFYEDYKDKRTGWGTYFGPMTVIPNGDGTASESPSLSLVTTQMLDYWQLRATIVQHPVLIARYSGLVWDFSKHITGKKAGANVGRLYVHAVNKIAKEGYHTVEVYVFSKLKQALSIALLLKDKILVSDCINTIISFENKVSQDNLPGIWGHAFDFLVLNKNVALSSEQESAIVSELQAKLDRLISVDRDVLSKNLWAAKNAATRLADYYRKKSDREKVSRYILRYGSASEQAATGASVAEVAGTLEDLHRLYMKYGLKDAAADMLLKVREANVKVPAEMKRIGAEINIQEEKIREYLDGMTAGGLELAIQRLLFSYIPLRATASKQLQKKSSKHPISYLITQQIVDRKGRTLTTIGPLADDEEGHLIKEMSTNLYLQSITLKMLIDELINKYSFNSSDILDLLKSCPVIAEDRLKIIERGLDAYFAGDFLVAIHLIIPQIEEAVRNVVESAGGNVLKESRGGGFHLRTFDDILRDDIIAGSLDGELVHYFKLLFTDQRGWNLRNNVCHGMSNLEEFNYQSADRLIHALLCLSMIEYAD